MMRNQVGIFVFVGVFLAASCSSDDEGGGPAATGGASSGGSPATGGASSTGGTASTGGAAAGGGPSGGGTSGSTGTGGTATGGTSSGGSSSGGTASGGAATGGTSSGGTASGGAATGGAATGGTSSGTFTLTSPVVQDGATIPARFRCNAPSPELAWTGGPAALSYAIVFRDVTPGASNGILHWIIYDLPPTTKSLPEGVPTGYDVTAPAGAHQGKAYGNVSGFRGPCGGNNTYEMTLYALDVATLSELNTSSTGAAARTAIEAHDTASVKLTILSAP